MRVPADATLADIGEFGLVDALSGIYAQSERVLVGPGDDAAVVSFPDGRVMVSTDVLVESRHFRRDWADALDIGHRVAAANLSDVNAMGGRAVALTVGLGAPPSLPVAWAMDLARGIAEESALVGASVVGGDLTAADQVVVSVAVLGEGSGPPVLRSGARPGDVVAIAGRQGWAAGGLAVLTRGFRSPRALVEAYRRPQPPYDAGPEAAAAGATAMIDVSDGLLADVGHLARASGVAVDLAGDRFEVAEPLHAVGAALGADPLGFVLTGGDDHSLVATFVAGSLPPAGWRVVGEVREGEGVTVDGVPPQGPGGHTHF